MKLADNTFHRFVKCYNALILSGTVSKHVAIVGELSRIVQDHNLLEVSETEQLMTTQASHSEVQQKVHTVFFNIWWLNLSK